MLIEARLFRSKNGSLSQFGTTSFEGDLDNPPQDIVYEGRRFHRFYEFGKSLPLSYYDYEDNLVAVAQTLLKMSGN
jgi:hypothetical protein